MEAENLYHPGRNQRGETLIESLMAIAILSIIVAASYAGLQMAIRASAQHKDSAVAETLLRTAAERLQDPDYPYVERAGCNGQALYSGLPSRAGYGPIKVEVAFWTPPSPVDIKSFSTLTTQTASHCPSSDPGLQMISLSVATPSGHTERLDLMKRRP